MFTATHDNRKVTWSDGIVVGDDSIVSFVTWVARAGQPVAFNFWGERPASLDDEFTAYLTVGAAMTEMFGVPPTIEPIPDNPDGYEPEGPRFDDTPVVAAAYRHLQN